MVPAPVPVPVTVTVTGEPAVVIEVQIAQRLGQCERLPAMKHLVATWTQLLGQHVSEEGVWQCGDCLIARKRCVQHQTDLVL